MNVLAEVKFLAGRELSRGEEITSMKLIKSGMVNPCDVWSSVQEEMKKRRAEFEAAKASGLVDAAVSRMAAEVIAKTKR